MGISITEQRKIMNDMNELISKANKALMLSRRLHSSTVVNAVNMYHGMLSSSIC
jgi:hypothetical protein